MPLLLRCREIGDVARTVPGMSGANSGLPCVSRVGIPPH